MTTLILVIIVLCLPSVKWTDVYDIGYPLLRIPQTPEGTESSPVWWGMIDFSSVQEAEVGSLSLRLTWDT